MAKKHKIISAKVVQAISLGCLAVVGAFAMGIETAGDVHPFASSEAALQEFLHGGIAIRGDVNGNGSIDSNDAFLLYQITTGQMTATSEQILRGDTDGDMQLTQTDLGYILRTLSIH